MKKATLHTIQEAISYYLDSQKLTPSTQETYSVLETKLKTARLLPIELQHLTPAIIRRFLNEQNVAPSTLYYKIYLPLKALINHYIKEHQLNIPLDLKGLIKQPKYQEPMEGEQQYLTLNEVQELAALDLSNHPKVAYARELFLLMCYSGMAVGDLINFHPEKAISADGKWFKYQRKKNGNLCTVPLLPMLENVIKRNEWPVKMAKRTIQYAFKPLEALVGKPVSSHWGRHTFGCIMLEVGFRMQTVSKMMGHTSIETTERFYAKVSQESIMRDMEEMQDRLKLFGV